MGLLCRCEAHKSGDPAEMDNSSQDNYCVQCGARLLEGMKFGGACGRTVHRITSVEPPPIVNPIRPPKAQVVIPPPISAPGGVSPLPSFELPENTQSTKPPIVDSHSIESTIIQRSGEENDSPMSVLSTAPSAIQVQLPLPNPPTISLTPKDSPSTTGCDLPLMASEEGSFSAQSPVNTTVSLSKQSEGNVKDTPADWSERFSRSREESSNSTERRTAQEEPHFSLTKPLSLRQCRRCGADITREGGTVVRRGIGYCFFCGSVVQPFEASGVGGSSDGRSEEYGSVDSTFVDGGQCAGSMDDDANKEDIVAGASGSRQSGSNPTTVVHIHTYVPQPASECSSSGSISPFGVGFIIGILRALFGVLFLPIVAIVLFINWVNTPNNRR